ncbi:MAG: hypothetical protein ACYS1C_12875, partial [Planctomycetota bacterium]
DNKGNMARAYEQLAAIHKARGDFPAAARTYGKLDELAGGSIEIRKELLNCWLQSQEPARLVPPLEQWLAAAGPGQNRPLLELSLDTAESLAAAGHPQEARAVLDLTARAGGGGADGQIARRIEELRRRLGE